MTRTTKIIGGAVLGLAALITIAIVLLLNYDWNRARPWLNSRVSEAIGRSFSINGNLALTWEKPPTPQAGSIRLR